MSYKIEIPESRKYIHIRIEGDFSAQDSHEWLAKLQGTISEQGIERLLIDVRKSKNTSSVLDNYTFAYKDTDKLQLNKRVRTVILANPDDKSHDFVLTAMLNAGFNVRLFQDPASAVRWLEKADHENPIQ